MAKILLADDVYTARSMVERVLRHVGHYDVVAVGTGSDALQLAQSEAPDVIVLDIFMSDMDGLHTLEALRSQGVTCPVIAYTARKELVAGEFVAQGFSAYVSKDGNMSELLTTIRELVER
jgi:CheY-like chemotaxis protein